MKDHFYDGALLDKTQLRDLNKRSDQPSKFRFFIMLLLFFVSGFGAFFFWTNEWWLIIFTQLSFGMVCCSTFACLHESGHGTAFKSKRWNKVVAFICGLFHLYPSTAFRDLHFEHHRYTHIPGKDPEISLGNRPIPSVISTFPSYLGWMTGIPLILFKLLMTMMGALGMPEIARKQIFPFILPRNRTKLFFESIFHLLIYGSLVYAALYVDARFWALIVGQVVGHCLLSSYLTAEHNGLPHEGNILEKTRSMNTPEWVKILMWNMPYHAEHHAFPSVPFHALPELHEILKDEIKHKDQTHPQFHKNVLQNLLGQS